MASDYNKIFYSDNRTDESIQQDNTELSFEYYLPNKPVQDNEVTKWKNNESPAINQDNLNKLEQRSLLAYRAALETQDHFKNLWFEVGNAGEILSETRKPSKDDNIIDGKTESNTYTGTLYSRERSSTGLYKLIYNNTDAIEMLYDYNNGQPRGLINDRINSEIGILNTRINSEVSTLNNRVTSEVNTLNTTINSKISELNNTIKNNTNSLTDKINEIYNKDTGKGILTDKTSDLNDKINTISKSLDDKITALDNKLTSADTTNLATAKKYTDDEVGELNTTLTNSITSETTARTTADNALDLKISNIVNGTTVVGKSTNALTSNIKGGYTTKSVGGISAQTQITQDTIEDIIKSLLGVQTDIAASGLSISFTPASINIDTLEATTATLTPSYSFNPGTETGGYVVRIPTTATGVQKTITAINTTQSGTVDAYSQSINANADDVTVQGQVVTTVAGRTLTASKKLNINRAIYYGLSGTTLTKINKHKSWLTSGATLSFTANGRAELRYPSHWGSLSSIVDSTGLPNIDLFTKTESDGYNIYTLNNVTANAMTFTFKI